MDKLMPPKKVPKKVQETDYSKFSDDQIKAQLSARGLKTTGSRKKLVNRLKAEVQRAWAQYHKANKKGGNATKPNFPTTAKKANKPKKKQTPAQLAAAQAEAKKQRLAKLKRKAENIKKMEEQREAKRQKTEKKQAESKAKQEAARAAKLAKQKKKAANKAENIKRAAEARAAKAAIKEQKAAAQAVRMKQQKAEKISRQKLECFVSMDIKSYQDQLLKKIDPSGKAVSSISYNAVNKRFNIRFNSAKEQQKFTKNSIVTKPKKFDLKMTLSAIPSPVDSRCVMFLYPGALNHPDTEAAGEWVESQAGEGQQDLSALKYWRDSAYDTFSKFGKIVNIYRERGFMVIQFSTDSEAKKMMNKSGSSFNGCSYVHKQIGTPTKADKNEVLKEYPMPNLKKAKKEE